MRLCISGMSQGSENSFTPSSKQASSPTPTQTPALINSFKLTVTFSAQSSIDLPTETPDTAVEIVVPTNTLMPISVYPDVGYCEYVVQPGDTIQSVAALF